MGFLSWLKPRKTLTAEQARKELRMLIESQHKQFIAIKDKITDKALPAKERIKLLDILHRGIEQKSWLIRLLGTTPALQPYYEDLVNYSSLLSLIHTDLTTLSKAKQEEKESLEKNIASFLAQAFMKIAALEATGMTEGQARLVQTQTQFKDGFIQAIGNIKKASLPTQIDPTTATMAISGLLDWMRQENIGKVLKELSCPDALTQGILDLRTQAETALKGFPSLPDQKRHEALRKLLTLAGKIKAQLDKKQEPAYAAA
ncbi:MAG: hypothetical protein ABIJ21_05550 [Nanoarchaeota archaeon]